MVCWSTGVLCFRHSRGHFTTEDTEHTETFAKIRNLLGRAVFPEAMQHLHSRLGWRDERFVYADGLEGYRRMIETREREFVLEQLSASEARLLGLVEGLTPAQWSFREDAERWS